MLAHDVSGIRFQSQEVLRDGIAHSDETVTSSQEIFRERSVEEPLLVRYDIVQYPDDFAPFAGMSCHESERRREIGHPISHDEDIRFPFPDFLGCLYPRKRIRRVQYGRTFHRHRLIVRGYILCFSREKEIRILPAEIERPDNISFAQFCVQSCVELGNTSPERIEAG